MTTLIEFPNAANKNHYSQLLNLKFPKERYSSMRLAHIDSGLGNQMLDYAEYIAIAKSNPDAPLILEDLLYDLPDDRPGMFSKWNGYELEDIFHLQVPRLSKQLSPSQKETVLSYLEKSEFWKYGWDYAAPLCEGLHAIDFPIKNYNEGRAKTSAIGVNSNGSVPRQLLTDFFKTQPGYHLKRIIRHALSDRLIANENAKLDPFQKYPDNVLIGHSLAFCRKGFGIEKIDSDLRTAFRFSQPTDSQNLHAMEEISSVNAVSIHARRSDMLFVNGYCYRYGFFKRAVHYIQEHTTDPVFYFFTDEKSVGWCQQNPQVFGLDFSKDNIRFVNWNTGVNSYRDMQLMAACHHNIFTESSFGFWGAYLNEHPDKITCAPDPTWNATNDF